MADGSYVLLLMSHYLSPVFVLTVVAGDGSRSYTRKTKRGISGRGKMHRLFSTVITGNCIGLRIWNQMVWYTPKWFMPLGQAVLFRYAHPTSGNVGLLYFLSWLQRIMEWCMQKVHVVFFTFSYSMYFKKVNLCIWSLGVWQFFFVQDSFVFTMIRNPV